MEATATTMNTMNTMNSVNVIIVSKYSYDIAHIDDNRAWRTVYTLYFPDSNKVETFEENTGFGHDIFTENNWNVIPSTPETKEKYEAALTATVIANRKIAAENDFKKFSKELEEYNSKMLPQDKGQIVEITTGRNKGVTGKITWFGMNKYSGDTTAWYRKAYPRAAAFITCLSHRPYTIPNKGKNLIAIRPVEGDTFNNGKSIIYIDPTNCKVIEGYVPVTITLEDCYNFREVYADDLMKRWRNGY